MKSISDLEKRQQKFLGSLIRKLDAQMRRSNAPSIVDPMHNISELENKVGRVEYKKGGKAKKKKKSKSRVNEAGNYTKPEMRKRIFNRIKAGSKGGRPGQWSARKAQMLAKAYKKAGGGYK